MFLINVKYNILMLNKKLLIHVTVGPDMNMDSNKEILWISEFLPTGNLEEMIAK